MLIRAVKVVKVLRYIEALIIVPEKRISINRILISPNLSFMTQQNGYEILN